MSNPQARSHQPFIMTKEHRRFAEFCDACRRSRYIGICHGPPGVGKTLSARYYADWDRIEPFFPTTLLEAGRKEWYSLSLLYHHQLTPEEVTSLLDVEPDGTVFYTAPVVSSPGRIEREIKTLHTALNYLIDLSVQLKHGRQRLDDLMHISDHAGLVLIDEADRLKMAALEQLRDTYDRGHMGLVLIGMPGLEKRLARYPQLYSRVGFVHQFRLLSEEEVRHLLEQHWKQLGANLDVNDFTDKEAVTAVIRATGGNFRLIHRLLAQIERILRINELHTITKEVVEAAREQLVIGQA